MRPFRNPENIIQVEVNQQWIDAEIRNGNPHVDALHWTADWQMDNAARWIDPEVPLVAVPQMVGLQLNRLRPRREREREVPNNRQYMKDFPELNLDKLQPGPDIPCDITLQPFKVEYDTHEQIEQKLRGTVILIKNVPFLVPNTIDLGRGKFALLVTDIDGQHKTVKYDDVQNCRGIAPGYFMYGGEAVWLYRIPERQNQQGMSQRNMQYKTAGSERVQAPGHNMLLKCLSTVKDIPFSPSLQDVLLGGSVYSLRLSNRIAIYQTKKKGAPIGIEYCGRVFGLVIGDGVKVFDENDRRPSWIHKDFQKVNLHMGA